MPRYCRQSPCRPCFCTKTPGNSASASGQAAANGEEFVAALAAYGFAIEPLEAVERIGDGVCGRGDGRAGVAVSAAERLGDDPVDDAKTLEILGGDFHIGGRVLCLRRV